jgi:Flp pilus assembly pilin Flp
MRSTTFFAPRDLHTGMPAWWRDESGATSIEYGLLAALIVIACIGAFTAYADALVAFYVLWTNTVIAALP